MTQTLDVPNQMVFWTKKQRKDIIARMTQMKQEIMDNFSKLTDEVEIKRMLPYCLMMTGNINEQIHNIKVAQKFLRNNKDLDIEALKEKFQTHPDSSSENIIYSKIITDEVQQ